MPGKWVVGRCVYGSTSCCDWGLEFFLFDCAPLGLAPMSPIVEDSQRKKAPDAPIRSASFQFGFQFIVPMCI